MDHEASQQWVPAPWFLVTPPEPKSDATVRHALLAAVDRAVAGHAVTILEAPSGFGKTTLLAQWADAHPSDVAWLSITQHDDSTPQLLTGVLTALRRLAQSVDPDLAAELRTLHPDPVNSAQTVDEILRIIGRREAPIILVVDDAHLTGERAVNEVIVPLAEHSGGTLRFVLGGTGTVSRWFTRQLLDERATLIDSSQLAFTADEIALTIAGDSSLREDASAVAVRLLTATHGWPVAVRLALRDPVAAFSASPNHLQSSDPLLTDYIETFVLGALTPELRAFILQATTCDRLSAELGQILSRRNDSATLLQECVRQGLFLDSFVQQHAATVYQWHSLFAHHCQIISQRLDPARARRTNADAARWMASRFPSEAVVHALRADDPALATSLIREHWPRMIIDANATILESSCLRLGEPWSHSAEILLIRACCHDTQGNAAGAAMLKSKAASLLASASEPVDPELALTKAFADLFIAHDQETLRSAADVVGQSLTGSAVRSGTQAYRTFLLGWTEMRLRRDPRRAVQLLNTAIQEARIANYDLLAYRASMNLMFALSLAGQLTAAKEVFADSERHRHVGDREWEHYDGGIDIMAHANVDYWQNDLPAALGHCRTLIERGGHSSSYAALGRVYFALTAAAMHDPGLINQASRYLSQVSDSEAHGVPWPAYKALGRAYLAFASNDVPAALAAAAPLQQVESIPMTTVLAAEMYRRLGHPAPAMKMLRGIRHPERVSTITTSALVTTAAIAWAQRDTASAHRNLERALDVATAEHIVLPFADPDDALRELLTEHAAWGSAHESFLAARLSSHESSVSRSDVLTSPLSDREREVFGYLCTTMTAEEIASKLYVSVNTIRTHQRAIYRKLGVNNRRDAIRFQF